MRIVVATSSEPSVEHAMAEMSATVPRGADFLACYFTERYAADAVRHAVTTRLSPRTLHGGTTCRGVMATGGFGRALRQGVGCFAITDPDGDYGTALAETGEDAFAAAREATVQALAAAGRSGEAPDLVWLTATPGREEAIIAGIEAVVGTNTPVIGGSAADDAIAGRWRVATAQGAADEGLAVTVMFPSSPVSFAVQSGHVPAFKSGTVTRAEGRRVHAIDDHPAVDVYAGWTGRPEWLCCGEERLSVLSESPFRPLAKVVNSASGVPHHVPVQPAALNPDGSIDLLASAAEGETLCLMMGSADALASGPGRVTRHAALGRRGDEAIAGALVLCSRGCMLAVGDRLDEVAGGVEDALGRSPFLGVFTFGEQGTMVDGINRHGNLMSSCVVFGG